MGQSGEKRCPSPVAGRQSSSTQRPLSRAEAAVRMDVALGAGGSDGAWAPGLPFRVPHRRDGVRAAVSSGSLGQKGPLR